MRLGSMAWLTFCYQHRVHSLLTHSWLQNFRHGLGVIKAQEAMFQLRTKASSPPMMHHRKKRSIALGCLGLMAV